MEEKQRPLRLLPLVAGNMAIFLLMVAALEWGASFLTTVDGGNLIKDNYLNHMWKPDSQWTHSEWQESNPDFSEPYVHHYNAQGWLESYNVKQNKEDGAYRIFYVGDSFTEGTCPMDRSVPSLVERRLNDLTIGAGETFEVINTGTSSYSPTLYYLLVRHRLLDYDPDLIVVNVDMSDCFDDWKYAETLVLDDAGNPVAAPPRNLYASLYLDTAAGAVQMTTWRRVQLFLLQYSHVYSLIQKMVEKRRTIQGGGKYRDRWGWCRETWNAETEADVARSLDLLSRLVELCRKNNVKVMLTSVPHYFQYAVNGDASGKAAWSSRPHYAIADLAKRLGVPYLNSFESMRPAIAGTPQSAFYYNGDMHFNPRGYELWAKTQADFLLREENALLPAGFYAHARGSDGNRPTTHHGIEHESK